MHKTPSHLGGEKKPQKYFLCSFPNSRAFGKHGKTDLRDPRDPREGMHEAKAPVKSAMPMVKRVQLCGPQGLQPTSWDLREAIREVSPLPGNSVT